MRPTSARLNAVLAAAQRVLAARADQMLTSEEWERLALAVDAANAPDTKGATSRFTFNERSGLARVILSRGGSVLARQRATADELAAVAEYAQCQRGPFLVDEVVSDLSLSGREPANAAIAFLLAEGFLECSGHHYASATGNEFAKAAVLAARALPRRAIERRA